MNLGAVTAAIVGASRCAAWLLHRFDRRAGKAIAGHIDAPLCNCADWVDNTRKRDPSNWAPSAKAGADGVVDAGVLDDDDAKHLDGPDMRLGRIDPSLAYVTSVTGKRVRQARLVLHITELPEVPR